VDTDHDVLLAQALRLLWPDVEAWLTRLETDEDLPAVQARLERLLPQMETLRIVKPPRQRLPQERHEHD
jgi:hypothetical protein